MLTVVKANFSDKLPEKRQLLIESKVILRLRLVVVCDDENEAEELAEFWGLSPKYVHLLDVGLKPWSIWVHELIEAQGDAEMDSANVGPGEFALKVDRATHIHIWFSPR